MKSNFRLVLIWFFVLGAGLWFASIKNVPAPAQETEVAFSKFLGDVKDGSVTSVTVKAGGEISYKSGSSTFKTLGPESSDYYLKMLEDKGVSVAYQKEQPPSLMNQILISWVPTLLIIFLFYLFMRQLSSGSSKAMSFGQSRAKMYNGQQSTIRFSDVAGVEEAKADLEEIVEFLKNPKKFTRIGGRIPKGVLLIGPPGTGKTLLAKAIAGEASVPFFSISGSDFVEMFVGVGASRVRSLFENAKKAAPCLIFIDEIDAVGRHRGAGLGGGHDEREQTLNQLLVEMDGFEGTEGVILIAATNRVDVLDPALLRPGRFDRRIHVPKPDLNGRRAIIKVHTRRTPLAKDVDLDVVARSTPGFAGADLENLVNEAALNAARENRDFVTNKDFEFARDKVTMGSERKNLAISDEEKRHTAFHEAGHAIVGHLIPGTDPVHKVTIIPRGPALGVTMTLPTEDRFTMTKERCESWISFLMGGRCAEEIEFGHLTSGASNDIERATDLARSMVTEWGFSDKIGPLNFSTRNENPFVGREMGQHQGISHETSQMIDAEIRHFVESNYKRARQILSQNRDILTSMATALLDRETIGVEEIAALMARKPLPPPRDPEGEKNSATAKPETADASSASDKSQKAGTLINDPEPFKA
jgi:cell division protease FtsH